MPTAANRLAARFAYQRARETRPGDCAWSRSVLDEALRKTSAEAKLGFIITPKAFRRTFKDLARLNGVARVAERSISGHLTVYSTALDQEQRDALLGVAKLAGLGNDPEEGPSPVETGSISWAQ